MNTRFTILNGRNWTVSMLMMTSVMWAQTGEWSATVTNQLSIGEKTWPPVSNGVAFIDGKYIPPPYVISRREGEIYLNGIFWDWTIKWPPRKKTPPPPPPKEMPMVPKTITKETTQYDKDYTTYIYYTRQYLMNEYGQQKGIEMMVDVYKKLPCVRDAKLVPDDPKCIFVTWVTGETGYNSQLPPPIGELNITKEQAAQFIDKIAEIYVRGLGENSYYYVMGKGDRRQGTFGGFCGTFAPLAEAMRNAKDEAEFVSLVKTNQPPGGISETWLRLFYSHRDELPKWEPRLRDATGKK